VAIDFLHQLIEQAYAAAQASPAAVMQLESKLRRVQGDRQYWARESMPDADPAAPDRHQRVSTAPGGTLTPA
jgi:hypothetical protein